jgi:hypothetical protein
MLGLEGQKMTDLRQIVGLDEILRLTDVGKCGIAILEVGKGKLELVCCNDTFLAQAGLQRQAVVGKDVGALRSVRELGVTDALRLGGPVEGESVWITPGGKEARIGFYAYPFMLGERQFVQAYVAWQPYV